MFFLSPGVLPSLCPASSDSRSAPQPSSSAQEKSSHCSFLRAGKCPLAPTLTLPSGTAACTGSTEESVAVPGAAPHRSDSGKQSGAPAASWSQGQCGGMDLVGCCRGDTAADGESLPARSFVRLAASVPPGTPLHPIDANIPCPPGPPGPHHLPGTPLR